jgi:hypothetical protein
MARLWMMCKYGIALLLVFLWALVVSFRTNSEGAGLKQSQHLMSTGWVKKEAPVDTGAVYQN